MKKGVWLLSALFSLVVVARLCAQEGDSRVLNELKMTGEIKFASQFNLGAQGAGHFGLKKAELGFEYRFTQYSGVMYQLHLSSDLEGRFGGRYQGRPFELDGTKVSTDQFYGYTDILGELGVNQLVGLGFKIGKFDDQSEYLVQAHALNFGFHSGDNLRQDQVNDPLNIRWDMPINALAQVMPLRLWVIHDADFGRSNNDVSVAVHLESKGLNVANILALDWNAYYNYQGGIHLPGAMIRQRNPLYQGLPGLNDDANAQPEYIMELDSGGHRRIARHRFGGSLGASLRISNGMKLGFGAMVDYACDTVGRNYTQQGNALMNVMRVDEMGHLPEDSYFKSLTYAVGVRFVAARMMRINLGYINQVKLHGHGLANSWDRQTLALRFDALMIPRTTIYAGIGVDLRNKNTLLAHFNAENLRGYERLSLDVGVAYRVIDQITLCVGYFWGNIHNGGAESPAFGVNMQSFNTAGGIGRNKLGNALYLKTKFAI